MQTIQLVLQSAVAQLDSDSARLDAECLLAAVLERDRSYLYAWPERSVSEQQQAVYQALISRRAGGEPVAYLLGYQEFWSLRLRVTPDVLIPRPDTELLVEQVLALDDSGLTVVDVGTGSGAIALVVAQQKPDWEIIGVDLSPAALAVARSNGEAHAAGRVRWLLSDYLSAFAAQSVDVIVSNPPYIAADDPELESSVAHYEPTMALIAGQQGMEAFYVLARQAASVLRPGGRLLLEHGYQQAEAVADCLRGYGFESVSCHCDLAGRPRVTTAQLGRQREAISD
ncbi:peptide chain release factor N(5)-glutamine methyltransferase [bacterium]|nr:peptide chain release factor N(5)-glutamine methyltransferase [bacterium]